MGRTLMFRMCGSVHVVVHNEGEPSDADWESMFTDVKKHLAAMRGILVYTPGGGPNSGQRAYATKFWEQQTTRPRIAVVTSSRIVRGIMTALSWFMTNPLKAFAPTDIEAAYQYLDAPAADWPRLDETVKILRDELKKAA